MSNIIDEKTFVEIDKIISLHLKSKSSVSQLTLNQVKSLVYFNNQSGDLKALRYYYVKKEFFKVLIDSYCMQDKSLFHLLLDVATKFNNPYDYKNIFYNQELDDFDSFFELLIKLSDHDIINILNSVYNKHLEYMHGRKIHKLIYQLQKNKKYIALSHLCDPAQKYSSYIKEKIKDEFPFYKDGIDDLMSPSQASQIKPNNVILALLHNDITILNIFLKLNPHLLKNFDFKQVSFIDNEAMTYLQIIHKRGIEYVQNLFTFLINEDLNAETNEKIRLFMKNMDLPSKQRLTQEKVHTEIIKKEKINSMWFNLSRLKKLFSKKSLSKKTSEIKNESINYETYKLDKETVDAHFQFIYELNLDTKEKNSLFELQVLILELINMGHMNVKIKCDTLLILQDKLPKLTQTYLDLTQTDIAQKAIYSEAYVNAIALLINQFNLYYQELKEIKKQALTMNFTEQIVFLEKKYLSSSGSS